MGYGWIKLRLSPLHQAERLPSPLAGEGVIASAMTDEGYSEAILLCFNTLKSCKYLLRKTPHPTFADAKATFSRTGRRRSAGGVVAAERS
jgi:hypothetical protein